MPGRIELSDCCFKTHLHEGEAKGKIEKVCDLESYVVGEEYGTKDIIVILSDIFGYKYKNNQLVADALSSSGKYLVLIPDILDGDAIQDFSQFDSEKFKAKHTNEFNFNITNTFLKKLREDHPESKIFGIGHCFGGKYVISDATSAGIFDACAVAHPSLVEEDDVRKIEKPILFSCPVVDGFSREFRALTEDVLSEKKLRFEISVFSDVPHGFSIRADLSVPSIKYAKEKVVVDQLYWFEQFRSTI